MTEREIRDKLLLAIYKRQDQLNVDFEVFCKEEGVEFKNDGQKVRILRFLKENGYINAMLFEGGNGQITGITSKGVDYIEDLIAEGLKETDRFVKDGNFQLDIEDTENKDIKEEIQEDSPHRQTDLYETQENFKILMDQSIEPCFGVIKLAECFVKQLDSTADNQVDNVCMVGIFAPWGRGKSYFFNKIKEVISNRNKLNNSANINYDVVEFNAWKYQETPAVWAYLFETIYKHKNRCFRFRYTICRNLSSIVRDILFFFLPLIVLGLSGKDLNWILGALGFGVGGLIINFLLKNYSSAISLIRRYSKGISFFNEMGIQAEIEKELTLLLQFWIKEKKKKEKKKIILYVDDIDRCPETKMVSIIDSLRTVLENEEIRKRLIIICSVDVHKLKWGIEYKYKDLFNENKEDLGKIAIEQLDKIFLTGISLSPLDIEQQIEFLAKLADIDSSSVKEKQQEPYSTYKHTNSLYVLKGNEDLEKFGNNQIFKLLSDFIKDSEKELTPRKIRVIFYRMLLANNIISNGSGDALISRDLARTIYDLSCGNTCGMSSNSAFFDVAEMVVPY